MGALRSIDVVRDLSPEYQKNSTAFVPTPLEGCERGWLKKRGEIFAKTPSILTGSQNAQERILHDRRRPLQSSNGGDPERVIAASLLKRHRVTNQPLAL